MAPANHGVDFILHLLAAGVLVYHIGAFSLVLMMLVSLWANKDSGRILIRASPYS
jgi:hypothetical protein